MLRLSALVLIAMAAINASAYQCNLDREDPNNPGSYDQSVFQNATMLSNGQTEDMALIKPDGTVIMHFDINQITNQSQIQTYDQSVIAFVQLTNDDVTLVLGKIDASSPNIFKVGAVAIGSQLDSNKFIGAVDPSLTGMAFVCANVQSTSSIPKINRHQVNLRK